MNKADRLELIKSMHKRIEYDQYREAIRAGERRFRIKQCAHCEQDFEPEVGHQKYCSKECQKKAQALMTAATQNDRGDRNVAQGLTRRGQKRKNKRIHAEVNR